MFFWKLNKHSAVKKELIKLVLVEIENLLLDLEKKGKNIAEVKLKNYRKTHYQSCQCSKCRHARKMNDDDLRALREMGFKVFFHEQTDTEI